MSQALDKAARNLGFKDYATYSAYQHQQQVLREGTTTPPMAHGPYPAQQGAEPAPQNWLQHLIQNYTPLGAVQKRLQQVLP